VSSSSSGSSSSGSPAVTSFKLTIDSCVYYGGLDHVSTMCPAKAGGGGGTGGLSAGVGGQQGAGCV
jgi:hypothetical protein